MSDLKRYSRKILEAAACVGVLATCACSAEPGADAPEATDASVQALGTNLLAGPWQFSSEDFDPPTFNAASVYSVNGNSIAFSYQGKAFTITGPAISGIHFKQIVPVVQGGAYRLRLDVSNVVGATPALFAASLSGAAAPSSLLPIVGNASGTIDFVVSSAPGASPTLELVNKPITVRPGVGLQNFTVTASLTKTN